MTDHDAWWLGKTELGRAQEILDTYGPDKVQGKAVSIVFGPHPLEATITTDLGEKVKLTGQFVSCLRITH